VEQARGAYVADLHRTCARRSVSVVLDALASGGLLKQSNDQHPAYLPARDLSRISTAEALAAVRKAGEDTFLNPDSLPVPVSVGRVVESVERATAPSNANMTVSAMAGRDESIESARAAETAMSGTATGKEAEGWRIGLRNSTCFTSDSGAVLRSSRCG
jgi:hypothetical protein